METLICIIPLIHLKVIANTMETMILIIQRILKALLFLLSCVVIPITLLQYFNERRRLPAIKSNVLFLSATELAKRIRSRQLSSEEVVRAYIQRCKDVNPILNAIVESRFDAATIEAKQVDQFLSRTTKTEEELARDMPLLGVPVTVKGSIAVQGMSYGVGVKQKTKEEASEDAHIVKKVRDAGAIILLVSNTPELCLFWETDNKVTGTTCNPYDTRRNSGGSSGGEAALLSSAASLVGLVSDVAGSARLPAMFCGIFGHKPSACLVSTHGHKPGSNDKNWPYYFTLGTMARYADDLPLIMKIISESEDVRQRFDKKVSLKDVKFFYLNNCCPITNSINGEMKDAMRRVKKHIEAMLGVQVQKAELSDMKFAFDISTHLLLDLSIDSVGDAFSGKIFLEFLKLIFNASLRSLAFVCYGILHWCNTKCSTAYHNKVVEKKTSLKKQFEDLLGDNGVLIYPTFITPAHYKYQAYCKVANFTYLMVYNVLGLPVTQCPVGLNSNGLPIGVQIVANTDNDHLTIAVAQSIEKAFGGWRLPPTSEISV